MTQATSTARRLVLAALLSLPILGLAPIGAAAATPEAGTGAADDAGAAYAVHEWDWRDAARDRNVPVRLYLPDRRRHAGSGRMPPPRLRRAERRRRAGWRKRRRTGRRGGGGSRRSAGRRGLRPGRSG